MLRFPLLLATVGVAIQCVLWSVPATLAVAALPHTIAADVPGIGSLLNAPRADSSARVGIRDALVGLIGAEVDALQVAGIALQPNPPAELGVRADRSGAQVQDAALTYARVVKSILDSLPNHQ
ncbi:MAG: hypothetical protein NVSMB2_14550 [Chloroflexota bacterium]